MKKLMILLMTALAVATSVAACGTAKDADEAEGTAGGEVKNYSVGDFEQVDASGAVRVFIAQGAQWGIRVEESANPDLKTIVEKQGRTLHVYTKSLKKNLSLRGGKDTPVAYITMPALSGVKVSGASEVNIAGLKADNFGATVSGASKLKMAPFSGKAVSLTCSGASKVMAESVVCTQMKLSLTGASKLEADIDCTGDAQMECSGASKQQLSLKAKTLTFTNSGASKSLVSFQGGSVDARNSGAGTLDLEVDCEFLRAQNSGASKFTISGTADRTDIDLSGASKINTKGLNRY